MYLVTGATGGLGRRVVRTLRERDQPTRAFVRLTSRYGELEQRGADIFIGDLQQDRDIQRACQGVQAIISTHGSNASTQGGAQALDYRANLDLIEAALAAGVRHFVFISVLGADRGYEDSPVFKAKWAIEQALRSSGLTYTILRPSGFASNLLPLAEQFRRTGIYLLIGDPQNRSSIISTDDLARLAVESLSNPAAHNQAFAVGGPEILRRDDIPKLLGRLFNREPIILNPPLALFDGLRTALGWVNPDVQKSLGTLRTLLANEFYCSPAEIDALESTFGFKLETLEQFLRRYLMI